jgi:CofH subfamily radical SAM domain protein
MTSTVRNVMPALPRLRVEARAGSPFELLIGLYAATTPDGGAQAAWVPPRTAWSPALSAAIASAGERSGEAWLHLLGLALELPHDDARSYVDAIARVPARELRRHLVGVYVPAWAAMVGADALERAAAGDRAAIDAIVAHPRYYAGRAAESLAPLLASSPRETKKRLVDALGAFAEEAFAPHEHETTARLREAAAHAADLAREHAPEEVVLEVTRGYVYEPEPEFDRVLVVPHLAARPALLLCQHRADRIICFPLTEDRADPEAALSARAVALGRALGDERRVQILRHLASRNASLDELAESVGLARSTAHHHLAQLRAAGLGSLPGTAAEILDDAIRAVICPDKVTTAEWLEVARTAHSLGLRSTATIMFGHVEGPLHWARHLLALRDLQAETGGFTEFVPLPFVHMEAPMYLRGQARRGPTFREALLMHSVARLVLNPHVTNIQTSWVKMGPEGAKHALQAGANDLGGTLMNESISRAAGTQHGQEFLPEAMEALIRGIGRVPQQRTTLYGTPPEAQRRASYAAAELAPVLQMAPRKKMHA